MGNSSPVYTLIFFLQVSQKPPPISNTHLLTQQGSFPVLPSILIAGSKLLWLRRCPAMPLPGPDWQRALDLLPSGTPPPSYCSQSSILFLASSSGIRRAVFSQPASHSLKGQTTTPTPCYPPWKGQRLRKGMPGPLGSPFPSERHLVKTRTASLCFPWLVPEPQK